MASDLRRKVSRKWDRLTREEQKKLLHKARKLRQARAVRAREDPIAFTSFVIRDEQTNKRIKPAPVHKEWHRALDQHNRVIIRAFVESGKSWQLTIGRVLWLLGRNPELRILICSSTKTNALKFTQSIKEYIEKSQELKEVFPHLKPSSQKWTNEAFIVERQNISKDYSVEAAGADGDILGARYNYAFIDDLLNLENTRTEYQRGRVTDWVESTVFGRMENNAQICFIANAWHVDDATHRLPEKSAAWKVMISRVWDPVSEDNLAWPERWSAERIQQFRYENGEPEYERQLLCIARTPGAGRVKEDWIRLALSYGVGKHLRSALQTIPPGCRTITGVDLGVKPSADADETAIVTILLHPDMTRQILNIEAGNWSGPDIVRRIIDHYLRYNSTIWVESNAAQQYVVQFASEFYSGSLPVRGIATTQRKKYDPRYGIEGLFAEMGAGKWAIPCHEGKSGGYETDPEITKFLNECRYYDPNEHVGDRLMAAWAGLEGAREGGFIYRAQPLGSFEEGGEPSSEEVEESIQSAAIGDEPAPARDDLDAREFQADQLWEGLRIEADLDEP